MTLFQVVLVVLYHGRLQLHGEVFANVETCKFSIFVCIDDGQEVYTDEAEDTEVALSAIGILSLAYKSSPASLS